mmetsp:Transcript_61582/g.188125  ORF Transcript_61582/g.188125 Transcript_61582/m.188125 type:complete len:386 (-) Transcript_61582:236-1393(-)
MSVGSFHNAANSITASFEPILPETSAIRNRVRLRSAGSFHNCVSTSAAALSAATASFEPISPKASDARNRVAVCSSGFPNTFASTATASFFANTTTAAFEATLPKASIALSRVDCSPFAVCKNSVSDTTASAESTLPVLATMMRTPPFALGFRSTSESTAVGKASATLSRRLWSSSRSFKTALSALTASFVPILPKGPTTRFRRQRSRLFAFSKTHLNAFTAFGPILPKASAAGRKPSSPGLLSTDSKASTASCEPMLSKTSAARARVQLYSFRLLHSSASFGTSKFISFLPFLLLILPQTVAARTRVQLSSLSHNSLSAGTAFSSAANASVDPISDKASAARTRARLSALTSVNTFANLGTTSFGPASPPCTTRTSTSKTFFEL